MSAVVFIQKFSSRFFEKLTSFFPQPLKKHSLSTVILFSVKVPVLSVHITLTAPAVSVAVSFLIRTFLFDNLFIFMASETATIVLNPSGTTATISITDDKKASERTSNEKDFKIRDFTTVNIKVKIPNTAPTAVTVFPIRESLSNKGLLPPDTASSEAILPICAFFPTASTTYLPLPDKTKVPE